MWVWKEMIKHENEVTKMMRIKPTCMLMVLLIISNCFSININTTLVQKKSFLKVTDRSFHAILIHQINCVVARAVFISSLV